MNKLAFLMILVTMFAFSVSAGADIIPVANPGFEDRALGDGSVGWWRSNYNPNSWYGTDPDGSGGGEYESWLYQWNPGLGATEGNWTHNAFGGNAPEGNSIVVVDNSDGGLALISPCSIATMCPLQEATVPSSSHDRTCRSNSLSRIVKYWAP